MEHKFESFETLFQELNAYLREHSVGLATIGSTPSLDRSADIARSILSKKYKTDKQIDTLENICNKFRLYIDTAKEFSDNYRKELIQNYDNLRNIYDENKGQISPNIRGKLTKGLEILKMGRVIYPRYITTSTYIVKEMESDGIDLGELKDKVTQLSDIYWNLFNAKKAKKADEIMPLIKSLAD